MATTKSELSDQSNLHLRYRSLMYDLSTYREAPLNTREERREYYELLQKISALERLRAERKKVDKEKRFLSVSLARSEKKRHAMHLTMMMEDEEDFVETLVAVPQSGYSVSSANVRDMAIGLGAVS